MRLLHATLFVSATAIVPSLSAQPQVRQAAAEEHLTLPAGTPLPVEVEERLPLRAGEPLRAHLIYAVYDHDRMVLPAGTIVTGSVVSLEPDHHRRVQARLRGDFTPFSRPVVRFTAVEMANGDALPLSTGTAAEGAPIYKLLAPEPVRGGFLKRTFHQLKQGVRDRVEVFTGPDKRDRALNFVYSQLPYHPQQIEKNTAWTVETTAPLSLPAGENAAVAPAPSNNTVATRSAPAAHAPAERADGAANAQPTWILNAYLREPISSETSHAGDLIHAVVAEPVLNPDGSVAVPQGAMLSGTVTQAHPARMLARAGELRFAFRQLTLPGEAAQNVRATITGADSASSAQLAMDSEGTVRPKPQDKVLVPLVLLALAARPLDDDGGRGLLRKDAAGSSTLGLATLIVGTAARQPFLAAGFGYYSAALSIYNRIFAKGKPVAFARDTRVIIETAATRSQPITASR